MAFRVYKPWQKKEIVRSSLALLIFMGFIGVFTSLFLSAHFHRNAGVINKNQEINRSIQTPIRVVDERRNNFYNTYVGEVDGETWLINSPDLIKLGQFIVSATLKKIEIYSVTSENSFHRYSFITGVAGELTLSNVKLDVTCDVRCKIINSRHRLIRNINSFNSFQACNEWLQVVEFINPYSSCGDTAGFLSGLTIGNTELISRETKDLFMRFGMTHILAVSGFQVTLIATAIEVMYRKIKFPQKIHLFVSISILLIYGIIIGFQPPIVRALLTFIISEGVKAFGGRKIALWRSILYSAGVMIVINPLYVLSSSFQLSFIASSVLGLWVPQSKGEGVFNSLFNGYLQSFYISLSVLPITLSFSQSLNPISFMLNALIAPLIPIITLFSVLGNFRIPTISPLFGLVSSSMTSGIISLTYSLESSIPMFVLRSFSGPEILLFYFLLFTLLTIYYFKKETRQSIDNDQ